MQRSYHVFVGCRRNPVTHSSTNTTRCAKFSIFFQHCDRLSLITRAYQVLLFFKFQYWGVFFWCIFMCRTNVRKYIFFKNAIFLCKFDNQFYKGIGSKIQREMCRFGFLHFMLQNC